MPRPATGQAFSEKFDRILLRCSKVRRGCNFCKGTCVTAFAGRKEAAIHRCSGGIIRFVFVFISCSVALPFSLSPYFVFARLYCPSSCSFFVLSPRASYFICASSCSLSLLSRSPLPHSCFIVCLYSASRDSISASVNSEGSAGCARTVPVTFQTCSRPSNRIDDASGAFLFSAERGCS